MAYHLPFPFAFGIGVYILILLMTCVRAIDASTCVLEVDLVFLRNETYAPTPRLPVIFAFQNSKLAPLLNTRIDFDIRNWDDINDFPVSDFFDLRWTNFSSNDPYFTYHTFVGFNRDGNWWLIWSVGWDSCTEDSLAILAGKNLIANYSSWSILFTTKQGAQEVDLVAATTNKNCSEQEGVVINVSSTLKVPERVNWDGGEMCASTASTTLSPVPCRVKIDSAAAASISSSIDQAWCVATRTPLDCPSDDNKKKSAAQRLFVGGIAAAFGMLPYVLV